MKGDERVEQIERDVHGLSVAKVFLSGGEFAERFPVDELGDEIPVAVVGLAGPEDLYDVGMTDLPQGADLAAHRLIPGGAVEELERPVRALDVIVHAVDLRKAALPEDAQDLEAALKDVADRIVGSLGPGGGLHFCWVRFRERLAATRGRGGGVRASTGRGGGV